MTTPAPEKSKEGLGNWVSTHQKAVAGILIVVGVIFFILISRGKSSTSSSSSTTPNSNGGSQYTYNGGGEFGGGYANSAEYGQLENQLSNLSTGIAAISASKTQTPPPSSDKHHHHRIPSGDGWAGHSNHDNTNQ